MPESNGYCTLSLYVPQRFYLPMLDVAARRLGFRSRSICVVQLLERLFQAEGLLDKHRRPTDKALAASPEITALVQAGKQRRALLHSAKHEVLTTATRQLVREAPRKRRHLRTK
jgi:hypothetical protein